MSFFDSLKSKVSQAAEITVQKTGEVSETAKLKLKERDLASDINEVYAQIGRLIYKQYKEQTDETEEIAGKCLDIDKKNAEIAEIAEKIAVIKANAEEQKAQRKAAAEQAKAAKAAAPAAEEKPAEEPAPAAEEEPAAEEAKPEEAAGRFCPDCGAAVAIDAAFCPKCGKKLGE